MSGSEIARLVAAVLELLFVAALTTFLWLCHRRFLEIRERCADVHLSVLRLAQHVAQGDRDVLLAKFILAGDEEGIRRLLHLREQMAALYPSEAMREWVVEFAGCDEAVIRVGTYDMVAEYPDDLGCPVVRARPLAHVALRGEPWGKNGQLRCTPVDPLYPNCPSGTSSVS